MGDCTASGLSWLPSTKVISLNKVTGSEEPYCWPIGKLVSELEKLDFITTTPKMTGEKRRCLLGYSIGKSQNKSRTVFKEKEEKETFT